MKKRINQQMQTPIKKWQEMSPMEDQLAIYQSDQSSPEQAELFTALVGNSPFDHSPYINSHEISEQEEGSSSSVPFSSQESMEVEHPDTVSEMKVQEPYSSQRVPFREIDTNRRGCKCRNSKCEKNYCDCLKKGQTCDPTICSCEDCHNLQQTEVHKKRTRKIESQLEQVKTCHCKKSKCLKKYCQCHSAGRKCSQLCECSECHNRDQNQMEDEQGQMMNRLRIGTGRSALIYLE